MIVYDKSGHFFGFVWSVFDRQSDRKDFAYFSVII